jgi:hypothetical protein
VNTHIRRRFVRQFSVILGAGLLGLLLGPMAGAITLSHAASPQPPPQSLARSPSGVSKINRDLPGAHTGMLFLVKDNTAHINGLNYPLAPGVLIETVPPGVVIQTHKGPLLPVSEGWQQRLRYPFPVQYWLGPGQTGITQMILSLPPEKSPSSRRK